MKRILLLAAILVQQQSKPYRLPATDLKQPVIWDATFEVPDGPSLAFGGLDQKAEDGNPHTRIKVDGAWKAIHEELRAKNPNQARREEAWKRREDLKNKLAQMRFGYLEGQPTNLGVQPGHLRGLFEEQIRLEKEAEALDAE